MYEYAYYRLPARTEMSVKGGSRAEIHLDLCHQAIAEYAQNGWRLVTTIKPYGDSTVSELVFERPVQ